MHIHEVRPSNPSVSGVWCTVMVVAIFRMGVSPCLSRVKSSYDKVERSLYNGDQIHLFHIITHSATFNRKTFNFRKFYQTVFKNFIGLLKDLFVFEYFV